MGCGMDDRERRGGPRLPSGAWPVLAALLLGASGCGAGSRENGVTGSNDTTSQALATAPLASHVPGPPPGRGNGGGQPTGAAGAPGRGPHDAGAGGSGTGGAGAGGSTAVDAGAGGA